MGHKESNITEWPSLWGALCQEQGQRKVHFLLHKEQHAVKAVPPAPPFTSWAVCISFEDFGTSGNFQGFISGRGWGWGKGGGSVFWRTSRGRGRVIRAKLANIQAPADHRPHLDSKGTGQQFSGLSNGLTISVPGGWENAFAKPYGLQLLPRPDGWGGHGGRCGCWGVPHPPAGLLPQPCHLPDTPPQLPGTKVTLSQALPLG